VRAALEAGASARELAVFYRVHAQSRVLEEAMRSEAIPYQIVGGTKFFDRAEVKDLLAYLRLIVNPASDVDLLRIINVPARKIGNKTIDRLVATALAMRVPAFEAIPSLCCAPDTPKAAKHSLIGFHDTLQAFARAATTAPPRELAEQVYCESGYAEWLKAQDSAEADARRDNIQELFGSISEYEEDARNAAEVATLAEYLMRITLQADADTLLEVPRVPMMTVHAAKGLEFEQVWLTGLEEQLFPLSRGEDGERADEIEEERRLAYVAITRARKRLFITHTSTRTIYGRMRYNEASRFLGDLPPASQRRIVTPALAHLSREFTLGASAHSFDPERFRRPSVPVRPKAAAALAALPPEGERYVEQDDELDSVGDAFDGEAASVRKGAKVRHPKFGVGMVIAVRAGADPTVTVKFPGAGAKQIKLSFLAPA
jgi:DNA helicase-2/ATP-dependent DNA helicase PcrA